MLAGGPDVKQLRGVDAADKSDHGLWYSVTLHSHLKRVHADAVKGLFPVEQQDAEGRVGALRSFK